MGEAFDATKYGHSLLKGPTVPETGAGEAAGTELR